MTYRPDIPWELDEDAQHFVERHPNGATQYEVADALGVSQFLVMRAEASAVEKLRTTARALRAHVEDR